MASLANSANELQRSARLNDAQRMHLRVSCQYIDKLLGEIEGIIRAPESKSPFPRYVDDLAPARTRVAEHYIQRIRAQLLRTLEWQAIDVPAPDVPATHAILIHLNFVGITLDDLRPKAMRGSGPLSSEVAEQLNGVIHELRTIVEGMDTYLRQDTKKGFAARLQRLQAQGQDVGLLKALEEIAERNGLVEFRARIDELTAALEREWFEVALFGRVSSGKSSLLNSLLSTNALPVGITPITAVPIKMQYGPELKAAVSFGDDRTEQVELMSFKCLVSEEGNPGNKEGITRARLAIPSPRLSQNMVLVDTPGLGSLAKQGSRETLAYLPSCDLAILLVDANSPLNEDDIDTLRLLYEAGIESFVLLSKADLLPQGDLLKAVQYTEDRLREELGVSLTVHPVSALQDHAQLLNDFYEAHLRPLFDGAVQVRKESIARKLGSLREAIIAALQTRIQRAHRESQWKSEDVKVVQDKLRQTTGEVGELAPTLDRGLIDLVNDVDDILKETTEKITNMLMVAKARSLEWDDVKDIVVGSVNIRTKSMIEKIHRTTDRAVVSLQEVAQILQVVDRPEVKDINGLFREMPRFELVGPPVPANIGLIRFLGRFAVFSHIQTLIRRSVRPSLNESLDSYRVILSAWLRQRMERLQSLVQSYADMYRSYVQQSYDAIEPQQRTLASQDLELLQTWNGQSIRDNEVEQIGA